MTSPSLPTVYLIRHGETAWSLSGQHTGRSDIPLTPNGEAVAKRIRDRLAGLSFDHVLSSPLSRARRTAELAGFSPTLDPDLQEWDYGDFEGKTSAEIRQIQPGWLLFRDGPRGGETIPQIAARVDRVVEKLRGLSGNVLVFAHGHFLRVLATRWVLQPVSFAQFLLLGTATISKLSFDHNNPDEPAIGQWNA